MNASQTDDVDIYLDKRRGWVIRTPMRVPDSALLKMCEHALKTYTEKLATMPDGPAKRLLDFSLPLLAKMRGTQEIRKGVIEHGQEEEKEGLLIRP